VLLIIKTFTYDYASQTIIASQLLSHKTIISRYKLLSRTYIQAILLPADDNGFKFHINVEWRMCLFDLIHNTIP